MPRNPNRRHDRQYFYKYLSSDSTVRVLRERALKWSSPVRFNDPFDVPRVLAFDFTSTELQEALLERLVGLIDSKAETPPLAAPILRYLLDVLRSGPDDARAAVLNDLRTVALERIGPPKVGMDVFQVHWEKEIPTMRILCVSETPSIAPMWTHYAEDHKGAVLELAALDEVDSPLLMAQPVRYREEPPKLPTKAQWVESMMGIEPIDMESFFTEYQLVKHTQWAYEQEWRVFSFARPGETDTCASYNFFPDELRRVILGTHASPAFERTIREFVAATYPHATVVRAQLDQSSRRILTE